MRSVPPSPTLFLHNGVAGGGITVGKYRPTSNIIFYIDAEHGVDDTLEGRGWSAEKPFRTFRYAYTYMCYKVDPMGWSIILHFAPGIYDVSGWYDYPLGSAAMIFDGTNTDDGEVIFNNDTASTLAFAGGGVTVFRKIHFKSSWWSVVTIARGQTSYIRDCKFSHLDSFSGPSGTFVHAYDNAYVRIDTPLALTAVGHSATRYDCLFAGYGSIIDIFDATYPITFSGTFPTSSYFFRAERFGSLGANCGTHFSNANGIKEFYCNGGQAIFCHKVLTNTTEAQLPSSLSASATRTAILGSSEDTPDEEGVHMQEFFAVLDEEYRRVGILSDENA